MHTRGVFSFLVMSNRTYNKYPKSFEDQVQLLKKRGLTIYDETKAKSYLQAISYYRLSAYFLPFQNSKDKFNPGITFQQIIDTYSFDRELRLLIFDCIERIEIAVRTQIIYKMALHYNDSHWQDKKKHFKKPYYNKIGRSVDPYSDLQDIINRAKTSRRPEVFIKHYISKYDSPANPPAWMCLELLTIGELSHLFRGLAKNDDKRRISSFFDVHHTVLQSWLHSITYVRNICAHHSRLWNRDLAVEPNKLLKPKGPWIDKRFGNNKRVLYFLCILKYLLERANPGNSLKLKLDQLFEKYPNVPIQYIGLPTLRNGELMKWQDQPLWE